MVAMMAKAFNSVHFVIVFASFCFLCFLGQLLTFGMSYYWPQLLQSPSVTISSMDLATTLGLIRSFGIPAALLMIPIMQSQLGHRWIVGFSAVALSMALFSCLLV